MPQKRLKDILAFLKSTDLQEVVFERKNVSIVLKRSVQPAAVAASDLAASEQMDAAASSTPAEPMTIKSTMVGTFFRSDSPDRPPFVVEGTIVSSGQPVAAIEAMKIMKDVLAPSDCKIVKALVANGHAVEYGQPLFEITPVAKENV
jgi:acetyl-CoA carboxylase biotin carboxyl carrier protein